MHFNIKNCTLMYIIDFYSFKVLQDKEVWTRFKVHCYTVHMIHDKSYLIFVKDKKSIDANSFKLHHNLFKHD